MILKNVVRKLVPVKIRKYINTIIISLIEKYNINTIQRYQQNALANLQGKAKIKCCFFAIHVEVWKYDDLFKLMLAHPRFEPVVLVCPVVNYAIYQDVIEKEPRSYRCRIYSGILDYIFTLLNNNETETIIINGLLIR